MYQKSISKEGFITPVRPGDAEGHCAIRYSHGNKQTSKLQPITLIKRAVKTRAEKASNIITWLYLCITTDAELKLVIAIPLNIRLLNLIINLRSR